MPKGENQEGKRRGRYGPGCDILDGEEGAHGEEISRRAQEYLAPLMVRVGAINQSCRSNGKEPVIVIEALRATVWQLAELEVHLQVSLEMQGREQLTGEEAKSIPGVSREIRALRSVLGLDLPLGEDGRIDGEDSGRI